MKYLSIPISVILFFTLIPIPGFTLIIQEGECAFINSPEIKGKYVSDDGKKAISLFMAGPVMNQNTMTMFATIQAAIDDPGTLNTHTIIVNAGNYMEEVNVTKELIFEGANAGIAAGINPGVRGPESNVNGGFIINAPNVVINGFRIYNGRTYGSFKVGVAVQANDATISNSIIDLVISPTQSDGITTTTNVNNLTLSNNTIEDNWRGIYLNPGSGHSLTGNLIDNNHGVGVGIGSDGQSNLTLTGNQISNHTLEGWGASSVGANVLANDNLLINNGLSIAHYGGSQIDASCNWWGSSNFIDIVNNKSGNVLQVPFRTTSDLMDPCNGVGPVQNLDIPKSYATIQEAIDDPQTLDGHTISVSAGSYTENILINKNLNIIGPNAGTHGTGIRMTEAVLADCNIDITAAGPVILDGFHILQTDNNADVILISGGTSANIQNNILERNGVGMGGQFVRAITTSAGPGVKTIQNNWFTGDESGGLFGGHLTWNSAMYINGAASSINILNNTFENSRTALNLDDFQAGINVTGNTFDNCGTFLSFGGVMPTNGQFSLGANDFKTPASAFVNLSNVNPAFRLDITTSTLNGAVFSTYPLSTLFLVESGMYHRGRSGRNGLVYYVLDNQYVVSGLTTIQSAVDYAASGDVININNGIYIEEVTVDKPVTLDGATSLCSDVVIEGNNMKLFGVKVPAGVQNVTLKDFKVQNTVGPEGGIWAATNNDGLHIDNLCLENTSGTGAILAQGPVDGITINDCEIWGAGVDGRGIVIWDGFKQNITITDNHVHDISGCCGIELQDGSASGVTMTGNTVEKTGDSGMSAVGLNGSTGINTISSNTINNTGRFGLEIKNPDGNGSDIIVDNNMVSITGSFAALKPGENRDIAGIVVMRRAITGSNVDVPTGVQVTNNTVSGYIQDNGGSSSEGFGIVIEGLNHTVTSNTVEDNDVGIQQQAGHQPYPGDGNQNDLADSYFGRGNSPITCGNVINSNNFTINGTDTREVGVGAGIVTNTTTLKSFCSIQAAIDDVGTLAGHTIMVSAGTYVEDVVVNKSITLQGAGIDLSIISGPLGGEGATVRISANGVIVDGFTITREGNNATDWNNAGLNFAGVAVQGQTVYGEVRNCKISDNRTGIDINNSNGNNIHNNIITNNHTGLILRNQTDNTVFMENDVVNNRTVGVLFLDASGGSNSPVQQSLNSQFNDNDISGNWYGQVVDRQAGGSLPAPGTTNVKNFECNWYGSVNPVVSTMNSAEPGYSVLIPAYYPGGSATDPGNQPDILGPGSANVDYIDFLTDGTDDDGMEIGFQPVTGACTGSPIVIASAIPDPVECGETTGSIEVTFSGGAANFTFEWTGGGPVSGITGSPYVINSLAAGPYDITITDANGTFAVTSATVEYHPVENITTAATYATIQAAIDDASDGNEISVCAGTYLEDIVINRPLTLKSDNGKLVTTIAGSGTSPTIMIISGNVTVDGFTLTNPGGSNAVYSNNNSNLTIKNNRVMDVGSSMLSGTPVHAVLIEASASAIDNIEISDNMIMAIDGGEGGSVSAITVGFSTGNFDVTNLVIDSNMISDIDASVLPFASFPNGGRGAYGILVNLGSGSGNGEVVEPVITNNSISDLEGLWAHGIGLEGNTPGADVSANTISDLTDHKMPSDAVAVMLEQNSGVATVHIQNNNFENVSIGVQNVTGIVVDATLNWWGDASGPSGEGPGSGNAVSSNVDFCGWLIAPYDGSPNPATAGIPDPDPMTTIQACSGEEYSFDLDDFFSNDPGDLGQVTYVYDVTVVPDVNVLFPDPREMGAVSNDGLITETIDNFGSQPLTVRYTVTPTSQYGCIGPDFTFDVVINLNPQVDIIPNGSVGMCAGTVRGISGTVVPPGSFTYLWEILEDPSDTDASTILPANSQSPTLAVASDVSTSGTLKVKFTATNNVTGCKGEEIFDFYVNSIPVSDAPVDEAACDSYTLPALGVGNYYTGSGGTGTMLMAGDMITSTQTIYVHAESGTMPNCTDENSFTVTIHDSPMITGDLEVCVGNTLQLSGSGNPAAMDPWTSSDEDIATVDANGLVTGVSTGMAMITYTDENGCTATVEADVNENACSACEDFLNLTAMFLAGMHEDMFHAAIQLTSEGIITNGEDISFMAGQEVELMPEFEVELGAILTVDIMECIMARFGSPDLKTRLEGKN